MCHANRMQRQEASLQDDWCNMRQLQLPKRFGHDLSSSVVRPLTLT